ATPPRCLSPRSRVVSRSLAHCPLARCVFIRYHLFARPRYIEFLSLHDALPIYDDGLLELAHRHAHEVEDLGAGARVEVAGGLDTDRKSTRLTPVTDQSRMPSSA